VGALSVLGMLALLALTSIREGPSSLSGYGVCLLMLSPGATWIMLDEILKGMPAEATLDEFRTTPRAPMTPACVSACARELQLDQDVTSFLAEGACMEQAFTGFTSAKLSGLDEFAVSQLTLASEECPYFSDEFVIGGAVELRTPVLTLSGILKREVSCFVRGIEVEEAHIENEFSVAGVNLANLTVGADFKLVMHGCAVKSLIFNEVHLHWDKTEVEASDPFRGGASSRKLLFAQLGVINDPHSIRDLNPISSESEHDRQLNGYTYDPTVFVEGVVDTAKSAADQVHARADAAVQMVKATGEKMNDNIMAEALPEFFEEAIATALNSVFEALVPALPPLSVCT